MAVASFKFNGDNDMKAKALTDATIELPEAYIVVELPNGQRSSATGYWVRKDENGKPIIVIKSGRNLK